MTGEKNLPRGMPHGYWCGVVRNQIVLKPWSWKGNLKTYQEKGLSNLYLSISEKIGRESCRERVKISAMAVSLKKKAFESRHPDSFSTVNVFCLHSLFKKI